MHRYLVPKKAKFTITGIHSKVTRHTKQQENKIYNEDKNQTMETNP